MVNPFLLVPALAVLAVLAVGLVIYLTSGVPSLRAMNPNLGTRTFLVLLRVAIGWHMMVEGIDKLQDPAWSSEGYLRQASGPLAADFRELAGTPVFDKLTLPKAVLAKFSADLVAQPAAADGKAIDAATALYAGAVKAALPEPLEKEWQRYYDHFVAYYGLDEEQQNRAKLRFDQARAKTFLWLTTHTETVTPPEPVTPIWMTSTAAKDAKGAAAPSEPTEMNIPELIAYYRDLTDRLQRIETEEMPVSTQELPEYADKVYKKLNQTRGAALKVYGKLKAELDDQTEWMKDQLWRQLDSKQQNMPPMPEPRPPVREWSQLQQADAVVKYGLVVAGFCLIVGLITRPACLFGAVLLLLFYLAMPPLPGWPDLPRQEGHYLYVNKNLIEMLALLTLATTASGRWLGIDGLLTLLWPWGRRSAAPADASTRRANTVNEPVAPVLPAAPPTQKEI